MTEQEKQKEAVENLSADELIGGLSGDDANLMDSLKPGDEGYVAPEEGETEEEKIARIAKEKAGDEGEEGEGDDDIVALSQEDFNEVVTEFSPIIFTEDEELTDDQKQIKADVIALFEGGVSFDADGNVLDKDNKQIASYQDVINSIGGQEEAIYDDAGNEVDKEGKIISTKAQLDIDNSEVNAIAKELGYEFKDKDGKAILYKEGNEGIKDLTLDIAGSQLEDFKQEFLNSNPVLTEVAKHLLAGGDLKDFQKPVNYKEVDVKKLTFKNKVDYIKQSYLAIGLPEDKAEKFIKDLKDDENTTTEALEALETLDTKQEEIKTKRQQAIDNQADVQAEENTKYWEKVQGTITTGKLGDFEIPEKDKAEFFRYLAIPIKDGQSQDMLDKSERDLPNELKEAYYRFKKYDVSDVVKGSINRSKVKSLRQRLKGTKNLSHSRKPISKGSPIEVSLDTIIT